MIRIEHLHKYFNKGHTNEIHVIDGIDLMLPEQGMTAIFGKSGCGKTTLLNVIGGLDDFASGSVTVESSDIRTNTDDLRNRYIGYIFQNYNLNKEESCFENVANALRLVGMSDEAEIHRRVMAALRNVGMEKYAKRPPNTLSGGQQQRIAIARAIVKNPRIILADEPTGNLDEANTLMIMNLLKSISKTRLVVLVTHEAHLVDHYCDTVIELADGKIVNVRNNANADGYRARDKNTVYLGELEKTSVRTEQAQIEYYGDAPTEPLCMRIVNTGGKLYVEFQNQKVQIIDSSSEIRLTEGVFKETPPKTESSNIDMSALPAVEATQTGKLFSFTSSLKSGYHVNFRKNKRGKKVLRNCMCMFAAIIVLVTAFFGTSVNALINASDSYNHNVFYLYTPDNTVSDQLLNAMENGEGAIDFLRLHQYYPSGDNWIEFRVGGFETFSTTSYSSLIYTPAAFLDRSLSKNLDVLAGTNENLGDDELLITKKVADKLLEQSIYGYVKEYRDLIGMISNIAKTADGKNPRIAGVVDSDELAVYFSEKLLAKYTLENIYSLKAFAGSAYGTSVPNGEVVLAVRNDIGDPLPAIGETIRIHGEELTVSKIIRHHYGYESWLDGNGIKKLSEDEWYREKVKTAYPELDENSSEFHEMLVQTANESYAEYLDDYYTQLDAYLEECYFFEPNEELWLYFEKNCEEARYIYTSYAYYDLYCYRQLHGKDPTREELSNVPFNPVDLTEYYELYGNEYYSQESSYFPATAYLLSDEDYVTISKRIGETHASATNMNIYTETMFYTVIHSANPNVTEAWLYEHFSDLSTESEFMQPILTPSNIFQNIIEANMFDIIGGLFSIAVLLVIMSLCMYFIMRSALMNRIKEIGIYRAIGVSKKNLVFKFFTESLVLFALTVLLGYIATSAFIFVCLNLSPLASNIFFYPVWMAGAVLAVLFLLSIVCGTLPILSLLKKTPSQILAKYDI